MSDRVFFIGALLLAMLMVGLALLPGLVDRLPSGPISGGGTDYTRIEVRDAQLARIVAGGESKINLVDVDGRKVLRVGLEVGTLTDDPVKGPHLVIAPDLEVAFAGRPVRITVTARAADKYGASGLRLNYWAGNGEGSGWQDFVMTREFQEISFVYQPPARNQGTDPGYDYFAIRPEVPEKERAIYVSSVVFQPLAATVAQGARQ